MARRNATRRSSCCEIDSATSCASSSGLRISTMLITTSLSVSFATTLRSFSISAPFLPITTPGRAEWMVTRHFLCGRSITMCDTAACLSCFISSLRILMSSCRSVPYSALPPRLDLTHDDRQVRKRLENASDTAAAARGESLDHKCLADMRLGDDEIVDVEIVIILGVSDRRFQALAHVLG